jgi:hypothetical protein
MTRASLRLHAGWLAGAAFALAVVAAEFVARGQGAPVHLLGPGMAGLAPWFDAVGFVLPGALLLVFALGVRSALPAGRAAGVFVSLTTIAAIAFALIGLLPFEPHDAEGARSRLHSTAVVVALLAMFASLPLAAFAMRRNPGGRAIGLLLIAIAVALASLLVWPLQPPTLAQRFLLGLFFAGPAVLSFWTLRRQRPL